jgi:hypothetical protein
MVERYGAVRQKPARGHPSAVPPGRSGRSHGWRRAARAKDGGSGRLGRDGFCSVVLAAGLSVGVLALAAGLLAGCSRPPRGPALEEAARKVKPAMAARQSLPRGGEEAEDDPEQPTQPRVPLDPDETLIEAINANLDLDTHDEQVLIVRKKGDAESPILVAVVDFDSVRERYIRSWESPTLATNTRTFNLSLKDIVGDHNLDLVCRGTISTGEITLDVFRKTPSPSGLGLYFAPICQIVSDGSIEIQEVERPEGYQLGQKNGPSFPIYAYSQDKESANILDLIRYAYHWQYQQSRYILTSVEKVPGEVVKEKQLADLFSSKSTEAFEQYLAGPWYRPENKTEGEEMILFLPEERAISIYSGDVQEIYTWKYSYRLLSNRMTIVAENESIQSLDRTIIVEVKNSTTIQVDYLSSEIWDRSSATYVKLSEDLQRSFLANKKGGEGSPPIRLSGLYRGPAGEQIIFEPPRFTWVEQNRVYSGGFSLFFIGQRVLYFRGLNENGLPTGDRVFIVGYSESEEGGRRVRTLVLTPSRLNIHGVEQTSDGELVFRQEEKIKEENGSSI